MSGLNGAEHKLFDHPVVPGPPRPMLPDDATAIGRIMLVYAQGRPEEVDAGIGWYQLAHEHCLGLVDEFGRSLEVTAGVVAVLSPRLQWDDNLRRAREVLGGNRGRGLGRSLDDAEALMQGRTIEEVLFDEARINFKVRAFFDNLVDPDGSQRVTIDRHIWSMIFDARGMRDDHVPTKEAHYRHAEGLFRQSANILGMRPLELQAICWVIWRRKFGIQAVQTAFQDPLFH